MRPTNPMEMSSRRIVRHKAMHAPPTNTLQSSQGETLVCRTRTSHNSAKLQEFSNVYNGELTYKYARSPDTEVEELMKDDGEVDSIFSNFVNFTGSSHNDSHSSQGSVMYTDRASWDSKSSTMSGCDQVQYSERLKEFENMIAPCSEQGEYVYLSEVNGFTNKKIQARYSDIGKSENTVRGDSYTKVTDVQNHVNKTDKNGNLVDNFSAGMNNEDDDSDLKKIIQECLRYFHSQVESRRSQVQNIRHGSRTQTEVQRSYVSMDRKYRSRGQVGTGYRPRSVTDVQSEHSDMAARQRPRSVTDTRMLHCHNDRAHDNGKTERDVRKHGDGLSLAGDVSGVTTRHGSPYQSRVHTLPPRIPVNQFSAPVIRSDSSGNNSLRRKPHLARRSKSTFGMLAQPSESYKHSHTQQGHVSTGRMFIEDVLHDINDVKVTDVDDKTITEGQYVELRKDMDNNDITYDPNHNNVSTPTVPNSGVYTPLIRSMSDFQRKTNNVNTRDNGLKHFKSLSSDSFLPNKFPNFTKNSRFIRNLTENKTSVCLKKSIIGHNSDLKTEDEPAVIESESSTNDLGVFDIIGENSGCTYPWQRDAFTQYEIESVKVVESETILRNNSKTNPELNESSGNIVKRQRVPRGQRPHSVGCIDTSTFDADLDSISQLQVSARARVSEPFIHGFSFRKRSSQVTSEDSGSTSNLESILENPADITLRHSAHRNVLSSPSVSPEMWLDRPGDGTPDADDESVFDSPLGGRRKPARNRSSGSITSGSEESDNEPSQPLARRGRRSAIVDTKNCGDVSPTTLSPEASPSNSSDEGENASGRSGRRRSSVNNLALNVYPGDLLVQEHHKKLIKRNTIADFYSGRNGSTQNLTDDNKKQRQPFSLLKLMKARSKESLAQLSDVLQTLKPTEFKDNNLAAYKNVHWTDLVARTDKQGSNGDLQDISAMERKRRESVWELFKSECVFLIDHLMVLKNCFLEPLKKLQVEGFLMYTEPSEIFSNLEELCYVSYTFCKDFIGSLVKDMSATDFGRTSILIKALQRFSAHSKDGSVYHTYCLNYSNALTYLEKLRKNDDFCEFEKWCEQDPRCNRLQLADLLIGPMQHCTKLPLLLHNIKKYTEDPLEKRQVAESIDKVEMSLEQLEDKMKWLKNFERVQEIQRQLVWPTVCDLDPRAFIPDNLKSKLLRQPCARLLACPTRQLLHEGTITLTETTKTIDAYMFLFDDIVLLAKMKKRKQKQTSSENTTPPLTDTYTVHRQPIALDRLGIHELSSQEATANGMKFAFVLVQISRFQQIIDVFTLQAHTESIKTTWLTKIKNAKSQFQSVSRANSIKEDGDTNSLQGKPYHGKSKSIDTVFLQ